jgi:hypothetical protein
MSHLIKCREPGSIHKPDGMSNAKDDQHNHPMTSPETHRNDFGHNSQSLYFNQQGFRGGRSAE